MSLRRLAFRCPMCSGRDTRALPRVGFPIRTSADQRSFSTYPRLIAAIHVLHRLLTPRHPPRALNILTRYLEHTYCRYAVFKVRAPHRSGGDESEPTAIHAGRRSLKTEQHGRAARSPHVTNPEWMWVSCGRSERHQVVDILLGHRSLGRDRGSSTVSSRGLRSPGGAQRHSLERR